ncbi:MAG: DUF4321 domain-containing protein [Firmicutes bacterium]|nr:DUF4321 domain-containing protein [Bacillota bacterium]
MAKGGRDMLALASMLITGIVLGGFLGEYLGSITSLEFLRYGRDFVIGGPGILDLGVIKVQFGITIKCTIAGVIGMAVAAFVYKKFRP